MTTKILQWKILALFTWSLSQAQAAPPTETVLHNFGRQSAGGAPSSAVIRDSSGNLYGTAAEYGPLGYGVVYKLDSTGHQTVLHAFTGGTDGAGPSSGVIRDAAGNLYGTTARGGTSNQGVVYKLDTADNLTVLYSFTGGADGGGPVGVVSDPDGNLYGAATFGGASGFGVVYKLDLTGTETVLCSFLGGTNGEYPAYPPLLDAAGNLYGTTGRGGLHNGGTVFKIDTTGTQTVLYNFTGARDGRSPSSPLVFDSVGNLYGATGLGSQANAGALYKLSSTGQLTTLYSFPNVAQGYPNGALALDSLGNLYGSTEGAYPAMAGIVFKVSQTGQETTLHTFTGGADGADAVGGVILDSDGNLYGTTSDGGAARIGTVYKVDTSGTETVLYAFRGARDGALPSGGVIADSAGNLYGTTFDGGVFNAGTVFSVDPSGRQAVLYNFQGGTDAGNPTTPLTRDAAGNLYGATTFGGTAGGNGTVYKVDAAGHETVLYSFTGGADGGFPSGGLVLDNAGNLYGTAQTGGAFVAGVVFKVDPTGHETVLYSFSGFGDGSQPSGGVIRDAAGNLYGTAGGNGGIGSAQGVVYKLDPAGHQTVLYGFTGGADGGGPKSGLLRDSQGNLYGTATYGGTTNNGVVFKLDPSGVETVLYSFLGGSTGGDPQTALIRDAAGNLYGTTGGGADGAGIVYKIDTAGKESILHTFTGGSDGGNPNGALYRNSAAVIFGSAQAGGTALSGVLFRLNP